MNMPSPSFHPAVAAWFAEAFPAATPPQLAAWPPIQQHRHVLLAAPTGSGKTLAAFLAAIDALVIEGLAGTLDDAVRVIYVSPLKALSNDIQRNLEQPLAGIREQLRRLSLPDVEIRTQVRTGDTSQTDRAAMRRRPPHILVTTPESLYLLLTSESGREMLARARSVIVDEIHAVAGSKRGSHLSLSLARLDALAARPLQRIGLSATQKPIEQMAALLIGAGHDLADCTIIDSGHARGRDLALALPDAPLEAVMSAEVWQNVYDQIAALARQHRTTLVFANTRRMVERVTRHLGERLGVAQVAAHHGSLAKELRLEAERRLKAGELQVLVATASLELGIDIGDVELVCQLGSTRSIATFLQRVGRANHSVGGLPKGRLFPLSRDDLVECTALLAAVRAGSLDRLHIPLAPLDVLAQQIVAEVSAREYGEDQLFALVRTAHPYRDLQRADFDAVVRMLAEGFNTRRGQRSSYLHRDAVNHQLRARKGARLTAITSGGAIPDNADYQVVLEPAGTPVGTLNEDFAIESLAGDIFQLGNSSYRILRVEAGRVRVEDAKGQPPTIPFWLGEAPARTTELSDAVSALRARIDALLPEIDAGTIAACIEQVEREQQLQRRAAEQLVEYLAAAKAMLGTVPTRSALVLERFFDESGGMQLIVHSPHGSRINKAFGLALRKRFCRKFNFELQAAATENAIVLSLGETHSFPLEEVAHYLHSASVEAVLTQAVLDSPLFTTRWRWTAMIALALRRMSGGRRTPAQLQRMAAEDLVAAVFPDQIACAENLQGEREVPDHPLVRQTLHDCLHEAMDIDGLIVLLRSIESGAMPVIARDLPHPSPLAQEVLNAQPYAFLDDAPLEERRTQAVASLRWIDPTSAADLGRLDPAAIAAVAAEAWPDVGSCDELHDALLSMGVLNESEARDQGWQQHFESLRAAGRATTLQLPTRRYWVAAESLPLGSAVYPDAVPDPALQVPAEFASRSWQPEEALVELLRGRLQAIGAVTAAALADYFDLALPRVEHALATLEGEGSALRGHFTAAALDEWCERRLLARIHRYTIRTLRAEIAPVSSADFMRFLLDWQHITGDARGSGPQALLGVIEQLEGYEVPASAWEADVLSARLQRYEPAWLDTLCQTGRALWVRLTPPRNAVAAPVRTTPIALLTRRNWPTWDALAPAAGATTPPSGAAQTLLDVLRTHGASFFDELVRLSGQLPAQAETALAELVSAGRVGADGFGGLRALLLTSQRRRRLAAHGRRIASHGLEEAGRWSMTRRATSADATTDASAVEAVAMTLLRRYGVVFRRLLSREADWLPPWYLLLRAYRRLEAQGHLRGGRFVDGMPGEQYALPDAVTALRAVRRRPLDGELVSLSGADPLNLTGVVLAGTRVPASARNRLLLRDGVPLATHTAGTTQFITSLPPAEEWAARNALLRTRVVPHTPQRPS
jgi:ATP-dependent Lhr-like helicase